ncbi:MAG: citrate synthase [Actinomycetia bacterium]|nr:citrate synthase [Actinomycetes bacterium]
MEDTRLVGAAEAARILGVKQPTLYAYVSRGIVTRHRVAGDRSSWFERLELEELNRHKGRRPSASGLDLAIGTSLTSIDDDRLFVRGHDAGLLATAVAYESVAGLLWTTRLDAVSFRASAATCDAVRAAARSLGSSARLIDHLALAVTIAASRDRSRTDLQPASVIRAASALVATMVDALPVRGTADGYALVLADGTVVADALAGRLWGRLSPVAPPRGGVFAINTALALLADHELATSTLAARVAASSRADPYAVVGAALAALSGPLHGTASADVVALFREAATDGADVTVSGRLARDGRLPGYGHRVYAGRDPRTDVLLEAVDALGGPRGAAARRRLVTQVAEAAADRVTHEPNVDFALGALVWVAGMTVEAGETIFAVARTAGWVAHAMEEYEEAPLRFRGRTVYTGPTPR